MTDPTPDKWAEYHQKAEEFGSSADAVEYLIDEIERLQAQVAFARDSMKWDGDPDFLRHMLDNWEALSDD